MIRNLLFIILVLVLASFSGDQEYRDGNYTGVSRAGYTSEPYFGHVRINIVKGKITAVKFIIRDSTKHEYFNEKYEKYFAGNALYIQQCRNDWKGVNSYPDSLLRLQDINKVDVISGATWSYNIFRAAVKAAFSAAPAGK